jgi:hypothetical protein
MCISSGAKDGYETEAIFLSLILWNQQFPNQQFDVQLTIYQSEVASSTLH